MTTIEAPRGLIQDRKLKAEQALEAERLKFLTAIADGKALPTCTRMQRHARRACSKQAEAAWSGSDWSLLPAGLARIGRGR